MSGFVLPLLLAAPAFADEAAPAPDCPEHDATACGRRHFEAGTQAFEKGDFAAAASAFQLALSERPHPVIRFNLALSFARLGRPSAAIEQLTLVQSDPEADKDLRARAEREQRSASQALSRVTFRLSDPTRESVELDGASVRVADAGELSLDPGTHHVRVISGSSVVLDQELDLAPGERVELRVGERSRRIDVVVVPDPARPPLTEKRPALAAKPLPPSSSPPRAKLSPVWFYAGAGATVALTGLTVWSGLDTQSALSDYQRALPHLDQAQADARVRNGHSRELRTNLLLAGSLLCGAGSAVLAVWFVDFGHQRKASVGLGPGAVSLTGSF
ncbi:MAG: hypothetical protein ABUL60_27755 [Myxococcales bacterium]